MKLYTIDQFIKLPCNTIYSRATKVYPECVDLMSGLYCKTSGGEGENDFYEQDLISEGGFPHGITDDIDPYDYVLTQRDSFKDFETDLNCHGKDGSYDENDLFIVWDKKDISKLIAYLQKCI